MEEKEVVFYDEEDEEEPLFWKDVVPYPSVPIQSCQFFYVFIDLNRQIQEVQQESVVVPPTGELSFSLLHHLLRQRASSRPGSQYKLMDTLVFNLDVDHDELFPFLNSCSLEDVVKTHLHVMPFLNDVVLNDAPDALHSANSIYFILSETIKNKQPKLQIVEDNEIPSGNHTILDVAYSRTKRHYAALPTIRRTRKLKPVL